MRVRKPLLAWPEFGVAIPSPFKAPRAWSDHNEIMWGACPTVEACTKADRCPLRDKQDAERNAQ